jgi:hypothetical protein
MSEGQIRKCHEALEEIYQQRLKDLPAGEREA